MNNYKDINKKNLFIEIFKLYIDKVTFNRKIYMLLMIYNDN